MFISEVCVGLRKVSAKGNELQELPEARFKEALAARQTLERQLRLESYQEQRIAERIKFLEHMLEDEIEHREELKKKQKSLERLL